MLSRILLLRNYVLVLACAISASGCSLRLNDKVEKASMNVNLGGGCMSQSGKILEKFSLGSASEAELNSFWDCTEKSLTTFNTNTEGESSDTYKSTELAGFISKYFMGGRPIPAGLLDETMMLKQSLIGGRSDQITRKELVKILKMMKTFRGVSQRLRPHMPVRFETFIERKYSKEQFEAAMSEFQLAMGELAVTLQESQGSYTFDHMGALFAELGAFLYPDGAEAKWVGTVQKWTKALRPAKAIFISPNKDEISQGDWATLYRMAPQYYSLYLRARFYTHGENSYTHGKGLVLLETLFDDSLKLLSQMLARQPGGELKSSEIEELLKALHDSGLLPVQVETANAGVRIVFSKLFNVQTLTDGGYMIRKQNLQQLSRTFHFATEGLRGLEAAYRAKLGDEQFENQGLKTEDLAAVGTEKMLAATLLKDENSRAAVESLVKSAGEISTVFPGKSNRMVVPDGKTKPKLSFQHLAKMHLFRSVNRMLIGAYAGPKANSLSKAELNQVILDVFPILRDPGLELADAETQNTFPKRLFEASLFLPSADGDEGLTMNEAIEFESLLFSTVSHANGVHLKMVELCGTTTTVAEGADKPALKDLKISPDCYRKNFLKSAGTIWNAVPGLAAFYDKLPEREQEQLFGRLERFLRKGRTTDDFSLSDTRSFIQLPYYVELLFARFDQNHDGFFENKEAEMAYPVFYPFLSLKCIEKGKTDPEDHHAIYMYLLANRTLPDASSMADVISYGWRRYIAGDKAFKANRGQVVEIFEKLLTL